MAIYLVMTLGAFAGILRMRVDGVYVERIVDLSGLARTRPGMAVFLGVMMFSLAGVPPLAGFFAKWYVFSAAIHAQLYSLAVIGVLASVVGCYYYLRIVKLMYFDEPAVAFERVGPAVNVVFALASLLVLVFWVYPAPLVSAAQAAVQSLF
jgi:NADH-quinone oxidoreductase subunit N